MSPAERLSQAEREAVAALAAYDSAQEALDDAEANLEAAQGRLRHYQGMAAQ